MDWVCSNCQELFENYKEFEKHFSDTECDFSSEELNFIEEYTEYPDLVFPQLEKER